jgi:hypothetical protein
MAENKFNYFAVVTTTLVKAKNQQEAQKVAAGRRGVSGELLFKSTDIERISSVEAHKQIDKLAN